MREPERYDIVIIGTGPAGRRAAIQAAKVGKRVVTIDRQRYVGGQAVHRGTIPSKTLREAVIHVTGVGQRAFYGAAYRVMTNVTMDDLLRRTAQVVQSEVDVVRDGFLRNDIDMLNGIAHFEDPHTVAVHTENSILELRADKVILATGSRPARPAHIPFDKERVVDSDGILDLHSIPKSMTVVGAGVIGTEYASIFATLGVAVTLIDGRRDLLEMVDEEIGEALKYRMREDGITLRLGHNVSSVEFDARGRPVTVLETGAKVVSDLVMYSIGRHGATGLLNLDAAGLQADSRGRLKVNQHFQTDVEHIYAVGDVIGQPALASTSAEQGRLAALHALGMECPEIDDDQLPNRHLHDSRDRADREDRRATDAGRHRLRERSGALQGDCARGDHRGRLRDSEAAVRPGLAQGAGGAHLRQPGERTSAHRAGGDGAGGDYRLLRRDDLQLSDVCRGIQGGGAERGEQAAAVGPMHRSGAGRWQYGRVAELVEVIGYVGVG